VKRSTCFLFAVLLAPSPSLWAAGHCTKGEIAYFSCQIKGSDKSVSVCGSRIADDGDGIDDGAWIQYRFGKPGKPDMVYPDKKSSPARHFSGESILANDVRLYALMFSRGGYKYEVVHTQENNFVGVTGKGRTAKFECAGSPHMSVSAGTLGFTELVRILAGKEPR
jgi:hypothetical protein